MFDRANTPVENKHGIVGFTFMDTADDEDIMDLIYKGGLLAGKVSVEQSIPMLTCEERLRGVLESFAMMRHAIEGVNNYDRYFVHFHEALLAGIKNTKSSHFIKTAVDWSRLSSKYAERIWQETKDGKRRLIPTAAAQALMDELKFTMVDKGTARDYYIYNERGFWEKTTAGEIKKVALGIIGDGATSSNIRESLEIASIQCLSRREDFNAYPYKINLQNVVYDLEHFTPEEHNADYKFTYVNPYKYDPEATCPLTDKILEQYAMGDKQWIDAFWELAGFCLQEPYSFNKMAWWVGDGANGKSTCQRLLQALVGDALTKTGFQVAQLNKEFFLTSVIGKRLALCGDAAVKMDNIDLLKQYTGGDSMETNVKYGDYEKVKVSAKLILCMNRPPFVSSHELMKPIVRRILWFPFDYKIKQPDPTIESRMLSELPGIFNKAVAGLRRLRAQGRFSRVDRGEKQLMMWSGNANLFESFITEYLVLDDQAGCWTEDLWDAYRKFMDEWGGLYWERESHNVTNKKTFDMKLRERLSDVTFEKLVRKKRIEGKKTGGKYMYAHGVRLADEFVDYTAAFEPQVQNTESMF